MPQAHGFERELRVPALPSFVPPEVQDVFDGFSWAASEVVAWRVPLRDGKPHFDTTTRIDRADPKRLLFVMRRPCDFLPLELARLHIFDMGFGDEDWALSPCAIDEATDELYARRIRAHDLLWIAADNVGALFWGLHDWAHFHNHGAFEQRAWTELHCDRSALAWLALNRKTIGLTGDDLARITDDVEKNIAARFDEEGISDQRSPLPSASRP